MTNNDMLRRIRYTFDFDDTKMIEIFEMGGREVTRAQVSDWLKRDDHAEYTELVDLHFAIFLNGLIVDKRGKKDGPAAIPEQRLNNNIILRKLKIALNLQAETMLEIFASVDVKLSKHELSAFFRKPSQAQYRPCKDQYLRNFIHGLQVRYRPEENPSSQASAE